MVSLVINISQIFEIEMGSLTAQEKNKFENLHEQLMESGKILFEKVDYFAKVRNVLELHDDDNDEVLVIQTSPPFQSPSVPRISKKNFDYWNTLEGVQLQSKTYLLKIKAEKIQQAYDELAEKFRIKDEEVNNYLRENLKLLDEKEKWMLISLGDQASVNQLENQVSNLREKLVKKEEQANVLRRKVNKLQHKAKSAKLDFSAMALRHGRTMEEYEKLLMTLKTAKREGKKVRECHEMQVCDLEASLEKIKKQKRKLLSMFKKFPYLKETKRLII